MFIRAVFVCGKMIIIKIKTKTGPLRKPDED